VSVLLRLCAYWFVTTAALGVYLPFFSLYMKEVLGFSGAQVGLVFAVSPIVGIVAQPLWGHVADRTGSRAKILTFLSLGVMCGYALLGLPRTFPQLLVAAALLAFFSSAQLPVALAVSFASLQEKAPGVSFARVRVWGTLGYFAMVLGVPPAIAGFARLQGRGEFACFHLIFPCAAVLAGLAGLLALGLPRATLHEHARARPGDQRWLLSHAPYLRVLAVSFGAYLFLQGPLVLFPVYVRSRGGSTATISYMWSFMLTAETALMFAAGALYKRLGPRLSIALGILGCGVRWLLCAWLRELPLIYPLQVLHGAMVVSLQVAGPQLVESLVPERLRSSGQAGLTMLGMGIGGVLSTTLAGWLLDAQGIDAVMAYGGACGVGLGLLALWLLPATAPPVHAGSAPRRP
jgi:PPP family 3-phenylpropionic acid transporter